jgi:hypothetical protein
MIVLELVVLSFYLGYVIGGLAVVVLSIRLLGEHPGLESCTQLLGDCLRIEAVSNASGQFANEAKTARDQASASSRKVNRPVLRAVVNL